MDFWQTLLATALGGGLALAGQLAVQVRTERNARFALRRQKHEEMISALIEYDHWLDKVRSKRVFGEKVEPGLSPFAKAKSIAAVHFPNLNKAMTELYIAGLNFEEWAATAGQRRIAGDIANLTDGHTQVYEAYAARRNAVMDAIEAIPATKLGIDAD